ncbi:MAG: 4-(cytidine 5'-diphospho)-2-C-methyl-D-erythritol kinase [Candidatus Atribacteria bacterium]|nr:4-(cytidine 5'-diphospho)-2-C-methyl-D-erythritol kinase [Candidatus Atribacteria bacterium]
MNEAIYIKSYAKINLYLNILGKLGDGYHAIETLFQTIDLFDEIHIHRMKGSALQIHCDDPNVPTGKNSSVYRAIQMLMENEKFKKKISGLEVLIRKKIPIASGLGGGSSNIAAILIGIRKLFRLPIQLSELMGIATRVGMDIPFFIIRGTVFAKGRGEILFPMISLHPPVQLLLINPGISISTEWAYKAYDRELERNVFSQKAPSLRFDNLVARGDPLRLAQISGLVYNCFEAMIEKQYPVIGKIKEKLKNMGSLAASLSGSGSTMYGIFGTRRELDKAYQELKGQYPFVVKTKTISARKIFFHSMDEMVI